MPSGRFTISHIPYTVSHIPYKPYPYPFPLPALAALSRMIEGNMCFGNYAKLPFWPTEQQQLYSRCQWMWLAIWCCNFPRHIHRIVKLFFAANAFALHISPLIIMAHSSFRKRLIMLKRFLALTAGWQNTTRRPANFVWSQQKFFFFNSEIGSPSVFLIQMHSRKHSEEIWAAKIIAMNFKIKANDFLFIFEKPFLKNWKIKRIQEFV